MVFFEKGKKIRAFIQKRKEGTRNAIINILGNSILIFFIASHYKETQQESKQPNQNNPIHHNKLRDKMTLII